MSILKKVNYSKIITILCLVAVLIRFGSFYYRDINYVDFYKFYKSAQVAYYGHNPYDYNDINKYSVFHDDEYNESNMFTVSPFTINLFLPFIYFNDEIASIILLTINIFCVFFIFYLSWKYFYPTHNLNFLDPKIYEAFFSVSLFLFANSVPVIQTLALGQVSIISSMFIVLAVVTLNKMSSSLCLALGTAFKFSLTPLYAILLFFKRGILYFVLFILFLFVFGSIFVFFEHNWYDFYLNYISLAKKVFAESIDRFDTKGGWDMINFDFLKATMISDLTKIILFTVFIFICFRERKNEIIEPILFLLASCISMLLVYHRIHDAVIIVLLLSNFLYILFNRKKWFYFILNSIFILFFVIPKRFFYVIQNYLGSFIGENSVMYLSEYQNFPTMLPLYAIMMFLLTIYALFIYYRSSDLKVQK